MKVLLVSPKNRTIYNFRGELIKAIKDAGHEVTATGPDLAGLDKIERLGVNFFEMPMKKAKLNPIGDLKYCFALMRLIKKEKIDAVLGYTIKPVIYGAIAARLAGVKNINCMVEGVGYIFTSKTLKAQILRVAVTILYTIAFACARNVIFLNPDDRDEFISRGLVSRRKTYVVNGAGISLARYTPAPYPERITFFMLSRLLESKGVVDYLQAAASLKKRHPQVRFVLLGECDGLPDELSEDDIKPYVSAGVVEHFGETDDVRPFFADASVYVLPSYREGVPRTVLEAMATARPVITSDAPGCRETVVDGENGFLVPVKSPAALEEKMEFFISNPEKIAGMGAKSLKLCREKFAAERVNRDMLRIMQL